MGYIKFKKKKKENVYVISHQELLLFNFNNLLKKLILLIELIDRVNMVRSHKLEGRYEILEREIR